MKPMIIVISRTLATVVETVFIISLSNCEKPQITAATARHMPPRVMTMTRLKRLMR